MGVNFDRWTVLKLFEVALTVACLSFKRVTDDEANRLFLFLQKISQEWSLLNNITWDRIGSAVADATYGGYVIITAALFIGRMAGELPSQKRITEFVLLGVGTLLFIILGSLEFAALDSVPHNLVDNAAVLGTLSLVTAAMFLLDMGGPRQRKTLSTHSQTSPRSVDKKLDTRTISQQVYDIEKEVESRQKDLDTIDGRNNNINNNNSTKNGHVESNGLKVNPEGRYRDSIYRKIQKEDQNKSAKRFDIYGKDGVGGGGGESDSDGAEEIPPKMEVHSPVWSKIRNGQYGKYDIITPYQYLNKGKQERPPSGPGDPGYVQYTAQHWGETAHKTPRQSPTPV